MLISDNSNVFLLLIKHNSGETKQTKVEVDNMKELCSILRSEVLLFSPVRRARSATPFILMRSNIQKIEITPNSGGTFHEEQEVYTIEGF